MHGNLTNQSLVLHVFTRVYQELWLMCFCLLLEAPGHLFTEIRYNIHAVCPFTYPCCLPAVTCRSTLRRPPQPGLPVSAGHPCQQTSMVAPVSSSHQTLSTLCGCLPVSPACRTMPVCWLWWWGPSSCTCWDWCGPGGRMSRTSTGSVQADSFQSMTRMSSLSRIHSS